jgi:hypothetical protein
VPPVAVLVAGVIELCTSEGVLEASMAMAIIAAVYNQYFLFALEKGFCLFWPDLFMVFIISS